MLGVHQNLNGSRD